MVSAGNTGATMASALLRMGRLPGVSRPAIATPMPIPGSTRRNVLLDAGANAECTPDMLVQFAEMGAIYARDRFGIDAPRVGLLSIGEEAGKGTPFVKEAFELLGDAAWQDRAAATFVGNVEGRDLMTDEADVIVTDGFTGNVALKTAEGVAKAIVGALLGAFDASDDARAGARCWLRTSCRCTQRSTPTPSAAPHCWVSEGVCIISHGSSSAVAIRNAIAVAAELAANDHVGHLRAALAPPAD